LACTKQREQGALLAGGESNGLAADGNLERPENAELDLHLAPATVPAGPPASRRRPAVRA